MNALLADNFLVIAKSAEGWFFARLAQASCACISAAVCRWTDEDARCIQPAFGVW